MNIITYNCNGLKTGKNKIHLRPTVELLCNEYDIVCLQETWLSKQELGSLNNMRSDFHSIGQARTDHEAGVCSNVRGGVAILWKTKFSEIITPVKFEHDWVVGIEINIGNRKCVILCVYMPYQKHENEDEYLRNLGVITAILDDIKHTCYVVCGDWNADPVNRSLFSDNMMSFCNDNNLIVSSINMLPDDSFTYVSDASHSTTWLDHIVCSADFAGLIQSMEVLYETIYHDHGPFFVLLI